MSDPSRKLTKGRIALGKTIRDVLSELRATSSDETEKGRKFEYLMQAFLKNDLQYSKLYDAVWLWSEYPNRNSRPDTGIDLVARERASGDLVAIQCKFYAPETVIDKPAVDSFLASSSKGEFKARLFITTTDLWGRNARGALIDQSPPVSILTIADLDESSIDWSAFSLANVGKLRTHAVKTPRPHQAQAIEDCIDGLTKNDRGRLIMACGTGKTFTSLRFAEKFLPEGGKVLFLVPSISLLSQAVKEWSINSVRNLTSFAVCSDSSAGRRRNDEDMPVSDLAFPATTDAHAFMDKFKSSKVEKGAIQVVFSTYQSISVISEAQKAGFGTFDLIVCDEAHRTTGVTLDGEESSTFLKVHDDNYVAGKKRLYMTATPKVFTDAVTQKAVESGALLADMSDESTYGPELHRLGFGEAVERDILSDYKVLVLAVDEQYIAEKFQRELASEDNQLNLEDTAKIVGCWNGLSKRAISPEDFQNDPQPMKRAVAFASSIAESKMLATMFQQVVDKEVSNDPDRPSLRCDVQHVDGTFSSFDRNEKLDWLKKEPPPGTARILSNARCLTEGVDVPALDAIMFLKPRDSQIDVVQAVGRVMRKLDGKKYGYVILPIAVPAGIDPEIALSDNKKYKVVWQVLQALRSHDERFDAMVNRIDLTGKSPQIEILGVGSTTDTESVNWGETTLAFPNFDSWKDAILARIVKKVGERLYWEKWAKDVAEIARVLILRLETLLQNPTAELNSEFQKFLQGLRDNLHPSIGEQESIEMLAQHLITRPVFQALFQTYDFAETNPVAAVIDRMVDVLGEENLDAESKGLSQFYASVSKRVAGIESAAAKQTVLKQLYEEFFKNAFPRTSERLGIVYTPNEVVDFMLRCTDGLLHEHFGQRLQARNVHILDPFTGTGTFVVRLVQSGLISKEELATKFKNEVHANELVLLAYYVASTNIEAALFEATGTHTPFEGLVLTDTFQMTEGADKLDDGGVFEVNNERAIRQNNLPIRVIVGNPPYSVGADSGDLVEVKVPYHDLDQSIERTYALRSTAKQKKSLYDSYFRAFRWASNRIADKGLVAFVTNGAWIDSNSADGFRASIADEFDYIYVVNLRGNQRTSGEVSRKEGGKIFGSGSRAPVAIVFLIKNGERETADIQYFDIGDYKTREQKLTMLESMHGPQDVPWLKIKPNDMHDWINHRSSDYEKYLPLSGKSAGTRSDISIFKQVSRGVLTARDAWVYNFSKDKLRANMASLIKFYENSFDEAELPVSPTNISWDGTLIDARKRRKTEPFDEGNIRVATPRPFVRSNLYFSRLFNNSVYSLDKIFPQGVSNKALIFPAPSDRLVPGVFIVNSIPDIAMTGIACQAFPLFTFDSPSGAKDLGLFQSEDLHQSGISQTAKSLISSKLNQEVSDEDVFYYVYGALSHEEFLSRHGSDFKKIGPRVPLFKDFFAVAKIGRELANLHLEYESAEEFPLTENWGIDAPDGTERFKLTKMKLREAGGEFEVVYNSHLTLSGVPSWVNDYLIFNKSPLQWIIDRYQLKVDEESQRVNDPMEYAPALDNPAYFVKLIKQVIWVSGETLRLKSELPPLSQTFEL